MKTKKEFLNEFHLMLEIKRMNEMQEKIKREGPIIDARFESWKKWGFVNGKRIPFRFWFDDGEIDMEFWAIELETKEVFSK